MRLEQGDKLVFIGDSITDCGRAQPVGEGVFNALGTGYVSLVDAYLNATRPDLHIRTINMGISGNTVRDLAKRWQSDVMDLRPDWLSMMIGINDVWRQFDSPTRPEEQVLIDEYEITLRSLVRETKPQLKGLVLMTPFYLEPCKEDAMRARMDEYGQVVKCIAREFDAIFVDTQAAFQSVLNHQYSAFLAWDRVHPNLTGHTVLMQAFLKAIE